MDTSFVRRVGRLIILALAGTSEVPLSSYLSTVLEPARQLFAPPGVSN